MRQLEDRHMPSTMNNVWYDAAFTSNSYSTSGADFGVSQFDTATGAETVVYQSSTGSLPVSFLGAKPNGVAEVNGNVFFAISQAGFGGNSYAQDDLSFIRSVNVSTGTVTDFPAKNRESLGLATDGSGNLLNVWYDGTFGTNSYTATSATIGVSRFDTAGNETVLYSTAVATPSNVLLVDKPNGVVEVNGKIYFGISHAGFGVNPYSQEEASTIRSLDFSSGTAVATDFAVKARESLGLATDGSGNLLNVWYDGVFGTNSYGSTSATFGVSRFDAAGNETILHQDTQGSLSVSLLGAKPNGVAQADGKVYFGLSSVGSGFSSFGTNPYGQDDSSIIRQLDLSTGSVSDFASRTRESLGLSIVAAVVSPPAPPPSPPTTTTHLIAVGSGAGNPPVVKVLNSDGSLKMQLAPFEATFDGGVRVALADFTGDGVDDIVAGAGPGGGPRVVLFDGSTGAVLKNFFAFESTFRGGVHVAAGDVDGDGHADFVLGAGSGGGPRVRIVRMDESPIADFYAYAQSFQGGVRVAVGDLDGDGKLDLVTAPGPSGGPDVRIFDPRTGQLRSNFMALDPNYRAGLYVAVVSAGTGRAGSIVVGPESVPLFEGSVLQDQGATLPNQNGQATGLDITADNVITNPQVYVFNSSGGLTGTYKPYGTSYIDSLRVSGSDAVTDGYDFAVAPRTGPQNATKLLKLNGSSAAVVAEFGVFDAAFNGSVFVGS